MIRRNFLKVVGCGLLGVTAILSKVLVSPKKHLFPKLGPRYVKELKVGEEFTRGNGKWKYKKIADGYYTKCAHLYPDKILLGDADVIRLSDNQFSWMGPIVEIDQL